MAGNVAIVAIGVATIALVMSDVFASVLVPRAVGWRFRPSFYAWRWAWGAWCHLTWRVVRGNAERREDLLALFAPGMLVGLLVMWGLLLVGGYGAILWGLRGGLAPSIHSFGTALYFAGTSLTTIGFGDITGRTVGTRFFSLAAAATGLALFSVITAYLFALFGAFQARETFVVMLGARAGTPPSGVNLLSIAGYSRTTDDLDRVFVEGQRWSAQLMESLLAYPVLSYFRSSHDYQSWIGTLGTLLDAATLKITTVDGADGQARILYNVGRHATTDLSSHLSVPAIAQTPGLERAEFDRAYDRLAHAGYALYDRDGAWSRFSSMRADYAPRLNALARFFDIPPLQWIGDREPLGGG